MKNKNKKKKLIEKKYFNGVLYLILNVVISRNKIYKINLYYAIKLFTSYTLLRQTYRLIFAFRGIFTKFPYFSEGHFSPKKKCGRLT